MRKESGNCDNIFYRLINVCRYSQWNSLVKFRQLPSCRQFLCLMRKRSVRTKVALCSLLVATYFLLQSKKIYLSNRIKCHLIRKRTGNVSQMIEQCCLSLFQILQIYLVNNQSHPKHLGKFCNLQSFQSLPRSFCSFIAICDGEN